MKLKVEQYREKIRSCRGVCRFFYRAAVRERRSYPFVLLSEIAVAAIMPFINIIFPKYIIEELMGGGRIYVLAGYVALIVFGNVILGDVICVLQETRNKQEDWFARKFDLMLSEKTMKMEFSNTEKESTIQAEQRAETGMSWYSGGLKGLSDCVVGICAACVTFSGIIFLVLKISPWLIGVTSAAVCINAYCTSKINRASEEVFEKTPHINKFYHYIYTKITFREYAKELRLYDGTELVEKKAVDNAKELNKMDNECAKKQFLWGCQMRPCPRPVMVFPMAFWASRP